mmetsp:Transcript_11814/g.27533  ORF Transcript_11814/g.27533 Transcript_11814/m.27533 type:complete len:741 (+) Transcript_11814:74-2296(+)
MSATFYAIWAAALLVTSSAVPENATDAEGRQLGHTDSEGLCENRDWGAHCGPGRFVARNRWNRNQCESAGCCYSEVPRRGNVIRQCKKPRVYPTCAAIPPPDRRDCGWSGIGRGYCEQLLGCCWERNEEGVPWCFFGTPYWRPVLPDVCEARSRVRLEAGYYGIRQRECESRGACWDENRFFEQEDAPLAQSMCYLPAAPQECVVNVSDRQPCGPFDSVHQCLARGCCVRRGEEEENREGPRCFQPRVVETPPQETDEWTAPPEEELVWRTVTDTPFKKITELAQGRRGDRTGFPPLQCPGTPVTMTASLGCREFQLAWDRVGKEYDSIETACNDRRCRRADFAGCILRMAGHDFMDYWNDTIGGSDGCIDLYDPDNIGLEDCLHEDDPEFPGFSLARSWLTKTPGHPRDPAPCEYMSWADFLVLAGEVVMEKTRKGGAPKIFHNRDGDRVWRFGRETRAECTFSEANKMPDPMKGCVENDRVFVKNIGLSHRHTAAILGVHSLGRMRLENSGFGNGGWEGNPDTKRLDTTYYMSMLRNGWVRETTSKGKVQWARSDDGRPRGPEKEIMLDSDLCLAYDELVMYDDIRVPQRSFRRIPLRSSPMSPRSCDCAWRAPLTDTALQPAIAPWEIFSKIDQTDDLFCGVDIDDLNFRFTEDKGHCCGSSSNAVRDCGGNPMLQSRAGGPMELRMGWSFDSSKAVVDFARSEAMFAEEFARAWETATSKGRSGRLQTLTCPSPLL